MESDGFSQTGAARLSSGIGSLMLTLWLCLAGAQASVASGWSDLPIPSGANGSQLGDVSCVSSTDCIAVGNETVSGPPARVADSIPLAERWDGSRWSIEPTVRPGTISSRLAAVSCTSSTFCLAVGSWTTTGQQRGGLVERWDGSSWSIVRTPNGFAATDVSCVSKRACMTVGTKLNRSLLTALRQRHGGGTGQSGRQRGPRGCVGTRT